jgi:hypothetical protein
LTQTQDYTRSFTYRPKDIPASRVFRERQSRRMFEELKRVKGSCAQTYEDLEQMHREVLLMKKY